MSHNESFTAGKNLIEISDLQKFLAPSTSTMSLIVMFLCIARIYNGFGAALLPKEDAITARLFHNTKTV
jgi:hypothetical protein